MTLYNYVKPLWQRGPVAVHDAPDEVVRRIEACVERVPMAADVDAGAEQLVRLIDDARTGVWIAWVQCEVSLQVDAVDFTYRRARFLHAVAVTRDALDGRPLTRENAIDVFRRSYGTRLTQGIAAQQSLFEQLDHESGRDAARSLFIDEAQLWRAVLGEPEPGLRAVASTRDPRSGAGPCEPATSLNTLLRFKSPNPVEAPSRPARGPAVGLAATTLDEADLQPSWISDVDLEEAAFAVPASAEVDDAVTPFDEQAATEPVAAPAPDAPAADPSRAQREEVTEAPSPPDDASAERDAAPRARWSHTALAAAALVMIGVSAGYFAGHVGAGSTSPATVSAPPPGEAEAIAAERAAYEARIAEYEQTVQALEERLAAQELKAASNAKPPRAPATGGAQASPAPASLQLLGAGQHVRMNRAIPSARPPTPR